MDFDYNDKLVFWAEWFQKEANMARSFYLYYFPADNTVEIYDHRTKKLFLKRTKVEGIASGNFYVGAKLNIFGRQIDILDYADTPTRKKLSNSRERTFCVLKPNAMRIMDKILRRLDGFSINNCLMVNLNAEEALKFYEDRKGDSVLPFLMEHLMSGPILGLELIAPNAVQKLVEIVGPENPATAKLEAPESLRALYGDDIINNYIHCAYSTELADKQLAYFFPPDKSTFQTTALMENTSLGIVKPHAVKEGKMGSICAAIYDGGMRITAMKMFFMERPACEEFYEVYKGIVPEHVSNVLELANGPCVAIEVKCNDEKANSYLEFRKLCGPCDVELAKQLRPETIRARFGVSKVQNAIHCTDLEEDTRTEIEYFFKILG